MSSRPLVFSCAEARPWRAPCGRIACRCDGKRTRAASWFVSHPGSPRNRRFHLRGEVCMAQHGYLGDDYGSGFDPNYDDDRARDRGWRGDRDRDWRSDRGMTFSEARDRGRSWDEDDDHSRDRRGPFARWGEEARSWFQDKPDGEPGRLGSRDDDRWTGDRSRVSDAGEWFGGRRH